MLKLMGTDKKVAEFNHVGKTADRSSKLYWTLKVCSSLRIDRFDRPSKDSRMSTLRNHASIQTLVQMVVVDTIK